MSFFPLQLLVYLGKVKAEGGWPFLVEPKGVFEVMRSI